MHAPDRCEPFPESEGGITEDQRSRRKISNNNGRQEKPNELGRGHQRTSFDAIQAIDLLGRSIAARTVEATPKFEMVSPGLPLLLSLMPAGLVDAEGPLTWTAGFFPFVVDYRDKDQTEWKLRSALDYYIVSRLIDSQMNTPRVSAQANDAPLTFLFKSC